jgi:radical S-adenosyl methionine domain-containing protein 2
LFGGFELTASQILDEYLKFLDPANKRRTSGEILKVGVQKALSEINFDEKNIHARGGIYDWSREEETEACGSGGGALGGIDRKDLEF